MKQIKQSKRGRGRPSGGLSLVTVPMSDIMSVCNSKANVVVGRVFAEQAGILDEGLKREKMTAELFDEA